MSCYEERYEKKPEGRGGTGRWENRGTIISLPKRAKNNRNHLRNGMGKIQKKLPKLFGST